MWEDATILDQLVRFPNPLPLKWLSSQLVSLTSHWAAGVDENWWPRGTYVGHVCWLVIHTAPSHSHPFFPVNASPSNCNSHLVPNKWNCSSTNKWSLKRTTSLRNFRMLLMRSAWLGNEGHKSGRLHPMTWAAGCKADRNAVGWAKLGHHPSPQPSSLLAK